MTHVIDMPFTGSIIFEMAKWMNDNISPGTIKSNESFYSYNGTWSLYHFSTTKKLGEKQLDYPYMITRAVFENESDAVMFKLRWA